MDINVIATVKKYRNSQAEWYSLIVRQYNKDFYINVYWKKDEPVPTVNHKVHVKARGRLFRDRKTLVTRISLYDAVVLEDLGIDEIEVMNEQKEEIGIKASEQQFTAIDENGTGDELPWN